MEADWEFEVGGEAPVPAAPVIETHWLGFVDLQHAPVRAWQLPEAAQLSAMAEALTQLNAAVSPVWTSKCDVWPVIEPDQFDPDELDAPAGCAAHAMACYIDILPKRDDQWNAPARADSWCRGVCARIRAVPLRCCRVDLVVRRAHIFPDRMDFGITAYLTACAPSATEAARTLGAALAAFASAIGDAPQPVTAAEKLQ